MQKFENTKKYLQQIRSAPIRSSACAIDAQEFASFFGTLYSSTNPLTAIDGDKKMIQFIAIFSLQELESALKVVSNLRSTDGDGMVVEMIRYVLIEFKGALIRFFKEILIDMIFNESLHNTILQMLPKDWDLKKTSLNYRVIVLLFIYYNMLTLFRFVKVIYNIDNV